VYQLPPHPSWVGRRLIEHGHVRVAGVVKPVLLERLLPPFPDRDPAQLLAAVTPDQMGLRMQFALVDLPLRLPADDTLKVGAYLHDARLAAFFLGCTTISLLP
jgi:hypothetical protein